MAYIINGPNILPCSRDKDAYRTYKATWLVGVNPGEGPATVSLCPGLPVPGTFWQIGGDYDLYAFCYWAFECSPHEVTNEPPTAYNITFTFSTKPEDLNRCLEQEQTDPLLALPKISGSFSKYTEEASYDMNGVAITNSAFEQIRGPHNEWDKNRLSVKIEQNVGTASQGYILPASMMDTVNAFPLWGLPPRTIKLSSAPWEKKFWGPCTPYYTRTLEFDIRYTLLDSGIYETWDRYILDEGTKVLAGTWTGAIATGNLTYTPMPGVNPNNPTHFVKAKDPQGENMKIVLNGRGLPAGVLTPAFSTANFISVQSSNTNNPLSSPNWWVPVVANSSYLTDPTTIPAWQQSLSYNFGNIISVTVGVQEVYISISDNNVGHNPITSSAWWADLGEGPFVNRGPYNSATTYGLGDVVNGFGYTGNSGPAGYNFIQKYPGADFTLLQIPLSF